MVTEPQLAAARVAALFRVARPAYAATLVNAALLVLVLWEAFPAALLAGWFALLMAVSLARIVLHRGYTRAPERMAPARWESRFVVGAVAAGALWRSSFAAMTGTAMPSVRRHRNTTALYRIVRTFVNDFNNLLDKARRVKIS